MVTASPVATCESRTRAGETLKRINPPRGTPRRVGPPPLPTMGVDAHTAWRRRGGGGGQGGMPRGAHSYATPVLLPDSGAPRRSMGRLLLGGGLGARLGETNGLRLRRWRRWRPPPRYAVVHDALSPACDATEGFYFTSADHQRHQPRDGGDNRDPEYTPHAYSVRRNKRKRSLNTHEQRASV